MTDTNHTTCAPATIDEEYEIIPDAELADHDPEGDAYAKGYADGYKACAIKQQPTSPASSSEIRLGRYAHDSAWLIVKKFMDRQGYVITDEEAGHLTSQVVRAYLSQLEPVSVSLEKCTAVAAALWTNWETHTARTPTPREITKAVLNAVGVKYE